MEECRNEITLNKLIFDLINENKNLFIVYSLIVLTLPIRDIIMPKVVGNFYNSISKNENINYAFITLIVIVIILQIINVFSDYIDTKVYPIIMIFIRDKIMKHIFEINKNNYNEINIGDIIAKIVKLPSIIYNHIDVIRSKIIPSIVTLTFILIYMFYIDWKLGLPMVVLICVLFISLYVSYNGCSSITVDRDKIHTALMSDVDDILRNIMTVMSFDKIEEEFERLGANDKLFIKHSEDSLNCSLNAKYINGPFIIGYIVYVCYYLFGKMKQKKMDSGQVITMVIISFTVINTLLSVLANWEFFLIRDGIIKNSLEIFKFFSLYNKKIHKRQFN
jgi:ABC-type multidrug transport system fused ATPase/permease subunit